MASAATPNFGLPQWTASELLKDHIMNDLNAAFLAIDSVPTCRVYPTSNQAIPDSTQTLVAFDGELFDTLSLHNPTYPGNLVAPVAGIYLITATVKFASNATGTRKISLVLDGTAELVSSEFQANVASAASVATVYQLYAGATVQVYAYQTSGGALNTDSAGVGMSFSMTRIA